MNIRVAFVGICIIFVCSIAGCGSVELAGLGDGGAAGARADGVVSADGGAAGSAAAGAGGTAGSAGAPSLLPIGFNCNTDSACGSGICVTDSTGPQLCCDGRPSECGTCVNGHLTPTVADGTMCGDAPSCSGMKSSGRPGGYFQPNAVTSTCRAGACVTATVDCSAQACPMNCDKWYVGCFIDGATPTCKCVDQGGSVCPAAI